MYGLYHLRCWNLSINGLYNICQSCLYLVRSRVNLQYHHERCHVYCLCHSVRSRKHLSVHGLYHHYQSCLYCLYSVRGWNVQKHGMYGLGQHRVYLLRRWIHLQYDY